MEPSGSIPCNAGVVSMISGYTLCKSSGCESENEPDAASILEQEGTMIQR
ncbi:hypothetical protein YC2023_121879 [Brassica napus]